MLNLLTVCFNWKCCKKAIEIMVLVRYLKNLTTQKSQFSLIGHQYTDTGRFKTVNGHLTPGFYLSGV